MTGFVHFDYSVNIVCCGFPIGKFSSKFVICTEIGFIIDRVLDLSSLVLCV